MQVVEAQTASQVATPAAAASGAWPWPHIEPQPHPGYNITKRAIDISGAVVALSLTLPLILLAAAAMALATGSSPLFAQRRVGRAGREFTMWKLRTMYPDAHRSVPRHLNESHGPTFKMRRDPRVARGAALVRKFSLDELPQLWNVLRGDMSLVGPRPPLPEEVQAYSRLMHRRLSVKPGLTALWQVSGRSSVPFRRWMAMDLVYVRRRSLAFDLWLLLRTPRAVISGRGAW